MKTNIIWGVIAGVAIGFVLGREYTRHGESATPAAASAGSTAAPGEISASWVKESDFGATEQFAGMTPAQRYTALKVLNERPCDCGCPHGSVALCKKQDPNCPRAPAVIASVAQLAKQGKSAEDILLAVKKKDSPAPAQAPQGPQKVELAAWTPIRGPKHAKVTILEFSDFQ
jgi:hypothetical protein